MKKKLMLLALLCGLVSFPVWADDVEGDTDPEEEEAEEKINVGFVLGYVNKQWTSNIRGGHYSENLWGEEGKRLHGIQLGMTYTPTLPMGLGVYTGLIAEIYFSSSKAMGYDEFTEFSLYVPIHANFKLPLSKDVSLRARGGLGLNIACHGGFTNHDAYYWVWEWDDFYGDYHREKKHYELDHLRYGKDGWPKRFNAALEFAVGIEIKNFVLSGGYSWGLTDHQFYKDVPGSSTHQDKLTISLGYEF
ncbi:MAG: hypothetical protein J5720_08690 [Bacteroidaceae bacterium]|nr:hypothetical protein [Bacteroidaceae bacterium]